VIGLGVVIVGLFLGRVVRPRAPRLADAFHFGASALVRALAAVVLAWGSVLMLEDRDALHIALAVLFSLGALGATATAALMLYVAVTSRTEPPT
jgi:hypothetical protein